MLTTQPTNTARPAVTLIEVLIAIFVVALGLLALLTLFPLGALSMGQAIKDDRVALTAANAVATIKVMDVLSDNNVNAALSMNGNNTFDPSQPGCAVLFDPIGFLHFGGAVVGGNQMPVNGSGGIRRVCTNWLLNAGETNLFVPANRAPLITGWFSSLDDITFTNDGPLMGVPANDQGQPAMINPPPPLGPGNYQREGRYSWAAMFRRPHLAEGVTEVSIVVFSGRSTNLNTALAPAGETPLPVKTTPPYASNVVTVVQPSAATPWPPDIRPGSWLLDGSVIGVGVPNPQPAPGHGDFYRITNVTVNSDNSVDLELQTPLKSFDPVTKSSGVNVVVLMDDVAEVIFKGVIAP
jgi:hypothetical protein